MAAILSSRFPDKAPELWAYQATIIRAERNYDGKRWVIYDRQYRREALARKDLNWSVTDPRLYNEAFTGHAKSIPRCTYCLQDDHSAAYCPRNPNRPCFSWFPNPGPYPTALPITYPHYTQTPHNPSLEICRRFNEGRCKQLRCKYRHACSNCNGPHQLISCPQRLSHRATGRSRSPPAPMPMPKPGTSFQPGQRF